MKLYKYVSAERINVLKNGSIRFTQPSQLNDPFDMQFGPLKDIFPEEMWFEQSEKMDLGVLENLAEEAVQAGLERVEQEALQKYGVTLQQLPQVQRDILKKIRERIKRLSFKQGNLQEVKEQTFQSVGEASKTLAQNPADITERFGVFSLTVKPDNLLMWAHYTVSHKGFVIELNGEHPFFNYPKNPQRSALQKVEYVERRNVQTLISEGVNPFRAFFLKSNYWSYESEWRLVRALKDADKTIGDDKDIHLFNLPADCVTGIILGLNMNIENRIEVLELIRADSRYKHVNIFESWVVPQR